MINIVSFSVMKQQTNRTHLATRRHTIDHSALNNFAKAINPLLNIPDGSFHKEHGTRIVKTSPAYMHRQLYRHEKKAANTKVVPSFQYY